MTTIYAYQKVPTEFSIVQMAVPEGSTELCTLDGITYVAIPDDAELPDQPEEIVTAPAVLTPELKAQIKAASPHVALTYIRTQDLIRSKYSADDEAYYARIGVGVALGAYTFEPGEQDELLAFGAFVETARTWGRAEREKLGL